MKLLTILASTFLCAGLYAQSVAPPCPAGYTCASTIVTVPATIPPEGCPQFYTCTPIAPAAIPPAIAAELPKSSITYLPKVYVSVGGGGIFPGHGGTFAYESISAYMGRNTYATTAQEFTMSAGTVQTCTMAGLSLAMYQFGPVSIGGTGLGGGCNSTAGTAGGAAAAQGFASFHIGKSGISIVLTADKTFTTDGRQGVKATFGVSYGR